MKHPVLNTEDYILYIELFQDKVWMHLDVKTRWTKKLKQEIEENLDFISHCYNQPLFAMSGNEKLDKFCRHVGFSSAGTLTNNKGKTRKIFRRDYG